MKRFCAVVSLVIISLFTFNLPAVATENPIQQTEVQTLAVNVNTAGVKELQKLPGIGKVTAERIIAYRNTNGPFASVDGLGKVKGVGRKTLEKVRPLVVVE